MARPRIRFSPIIPPSSQKSPKKTIPQLPVKLTRSPDLMKSPNDGYSSSGYAAEPDQDDIVGSFDFDQLDSSFLSPVKVYQDVNADDGEFDDDEVDTAVQFTARRAGIEPTTGQSERKKVVFESAGRVGLDDYDEIQNAKVMESVETIKRELAKVPPIVENAISATKSVKDQSEQLGLEQVQPVVPAESVVPAVPAVPVEPVESVEPVELVVKPAVEQPSPPSQPSKPKDSSNVTDDASEAESTILKVTQFIDEKRRQREQRLKQLEEEVKASKPKASKLQAKDRVSKPSKSVHRKKRVDQKLLRDLEQLLESKKAEQDSQEDSEPSLDWSSDDWKHLYNHLKRYRATGDVRMMDPERLEVEFGCNMDELEIRVRTLRDLLYNRW